MSNLHETVRERCADAIAHRCRKGNCRLVTDDLPRGQTTIVDVDRYLPELPVGEKKPDFFVFVTRDGTCAVVVEMKDGRASAADAEQLQAGASQVDRLLHDLQEMAPLPLLVHKSISAIEVRALSRRRVRFRGRRFGIQTCRCGDRLSRQL